MRNRIGDGFGGEIAARIYTHHPGRRNSESATLGAHSRRRLV